jgi:hypothetical protein
MMRTALFVAGGIAALAMFGCAHSINLRPDGTPGRAPSGYVTFFILEGNSSDTPVRDQQVKAEIVAALADRGLVETSPDEAEAVVVVHTATSAKHSRDSFYDGWGGWSWQVGSTTVLRGTEDYKLGTLVVDMFDAWTKKLVWHAAVSDAEPVNLNAGAHAVSKAVTKLFRDFPVVDGGGASEGVAVSRPAHRPDPPIRIIFSSRPALLVRIDGEPRYEGFGDTGLQRITNANALIIRDESGMYYLRLAGKWLEAYDVNGSWSPAGTVPEGADITLQETQKLWRNELAGAISAHELTPVVYVAMEAAELIVTDGEPEYVPVDGTSLLRIRNTTASVFKEPTDKELYVHLPNGWFRAWTANGPWQPVLEADLPADLAQVRSLGTSAPSKASERF